MRKLAVTAVAAAAMALVSLSPAHAAGGSVPLETQSWSWQGLFGRYDKAALQRGYQVYKDICAACHSMRLVNFRNLSDLGYTEDEIKAIASEYEVVDGPDDEGEMFDRAAKPSDPFPSPYPNDKAAAASNGGALPPDLSLINKARVNGPDYVYNLLTRYLEEAPTGFDLSEGKYYNEVFPGHQISMAPPLYDEAVEYADGTPMTLEQHARDVVHFLNWAAEPELEERKSLGVKVLLFLLVLTIMLYALKVKIWRDVKH